VALRLNQSASFQIMREGCLCKIRLFVVSDEVLAGGSILLEGSAIISEHPRRPMHHVSQRYRKGLQPPQTVTKAHPHHTCIYDTDLNLSPGRLRSPPQGSVPHHSMQFLLLTNHT